MLDNPSTKAQAGTGSGLLSPDNDDRTARNLREAYESHNIAWKDVVHWNAVPFPVANSDGGSTRGEQREGARRIIEFVRRCPNLKMVLLLGDAARHGWAFAGLAVPVPVAPWKVPLLRQGAQLRARRPRPTRQGDSPSGKGTKRGVTSRTVERTR